MHTPDVLDPAVLDNLRQLTPPGEPDLLLQVLTIFLDEAPKRIERLQSALAAGDAAGVQRAAHSLKGSAGNIGAHALFDASRHLDELGKAGDLAAAASALRHLLDEYARVETEIQRVLNA